METTKLDEIEIVLSDLNLDDIKSVLDKWKEVSILRAKVEQVEESLKEKVKIYLKERQWTNYYCKDNGINVTLSTVKRETIDSNQLKMILTPGQLAQVTKTTTYEKLGIMTAEMREKVKKFLKKKK